jgi:Tfp pilus assembly protein PilV
MKNQKGIAPIIFIIIIVALLAVAGFFAYQYFSTKTSVQPQIQSQQQNQNQQQQTVNQQTANSQPINQVAGWKTYTSTQYGFEIQYPNSMSIQNSANSVSLVSADKQRKIDIKVESIEPGQDCRKTAWAADTSNITIDNTMFVGVASGLKDEPYYGVLYCIIRNSSDYMITSHLFHVSGGTNNFPENDTALNQIISTFKFTK